MIGKKCAGGGRREIISIYYYLPHSWPAAPGLSGASYEFGIRGWLGAGHGINKPIYASVELNSMMDDID